mmetsp:Transcript_79515/g.157533  ORF Transcript_79515/g.157533 Transcript_79515/m.157533 type:complete len:216 (+) Transcript_79515:691-1338(+)
MAASGAAATVPPKLPPLVAVELRMQPNLAARAATIRLSDTTVAAKSAATSRFIAFRNSGGLLAAEPASPSAAACTDSFRTSSRRVKDSLLSRPCRSRLLLRSPAATAASGAATVPPELPPFVAAALRMQPNLAARAATNRLSDANVAAKSSASSRFTAPLPLRDSGGLSLAEPAALSAKPGTAFCRTPASRRVKGSLPLPCPIVALLLLSRLSLS